MLWPAAPTVTSVLRTIVPDLAAAPLAPGIAAQSPFPPPFSAIDAPRRSVSRPPLDDPGRDGRVTLALAALVRFGDPQIAIGPPGEMIAPPASAFAPVPVPAPIRSRAARQWSTDFWLVARAGSNRQAGFGSGELGGAQAGARVAYALDRNRHLAAFARVDTPLSGKGREAAVGLDWRPTRWPVRIVAEERVPLDGGSAAPAAGLVGGFGPVLRHGIRLEGYGQAGIIARRGGVGFADGAIRATRPIGALAGLSFDLGAGAWGGAQRDAARLDLGPTLGASVPVGGHPIRVALDWRERVAGKARPGSGLALTIGASF
jgi:hypothetical protein